MAGLHSAATGGFGKVRPPGKKNDPEPPLLKRTEESWVCWSQALVRSKPYLALSWAVGGTLNSHMPSSAAAIPAKDRRAIRISMGRFMASLRVGAYSRSIALGGRRMKAGVVRVR